MCDFDVVCPNVIYYVSLFVVTVLHAVKAQVTYNLKGTLQPKM